MADFIVSVILILAIGSALAYIVKAKKNGVHCIGCPDAGSCSACRTAEGPVHTCGGNCSACSGCHREQEH